jgi:KaiC/GvpD/RAD55 family RecA-like ATPase
MTDHPRLKRIDRATPGTPPPGLSALTTGGVIGLDELLALELPAQVFLVEGLLVDEASGFIGGEEKTGKTILSEHLGLALALGEPFARRFAVPNRVRVLFVEEEDGVRRTKRRLEKMLRTFGRDPADPAVRADLAKWFRLSIMAGADLDSEEWWAELEEEMAAYQPGVLLLDNLSKLTGRNINAADEMRAVLTRIDVLRRRFGCVVLIVHHYRKQQGERLGRGSQEISGSYRLGAWAEQSLFLEPRDRTGRIITLTLQSKDADPLPNPLRFTVTETADQLEVALVELATTEHDSAEKVLSALRSATPTEPKTGTPGVTIRTLVLKTNLADKTVRRTVAELVQSKLVEEVGEAARGVKLYLRTWDPRPDQGSTLDTPLDQGEVPF